MHNPFRRQSIDERMADGLSSAIAAALCVVTARARFPELDTDGTDLYHATQHAKACGATHGQVATAMREGR
jgi:hypothetical protein